MERNFWEGNRRWETQWGIIQDDRLPKFALQNIGCVKKGLVNICEENVQL